MDSLLKKATQDYQALLLGHPDLKSIPPHDLGRMALYLEEGNSKAELILMYLSLLGKEGRQVLIDEIKRHEWEQTHPL